MTAVVDDPPIEHRGRRSRAERRRSRRCSRRIGRRIIRRPSRWLNSPWPTERIVQYLTALVLVGGATFAVLQVVHLDLVFTNNTPTGGDMGAHVMAPAFLRDVLLPNGQLTGWSMYWYAGFPMYRFYMVVPALMIVGLNALWIPYGVAFKIVAILGLVTLPFCCWAFGRLARFRYPIPELMALAGMLFLFDESFSIYGGNVKSTMAGEFSFSIALSFAILGFGLFARGLQTGKYRSWAAIVLALAILSHGVVAIFVVLGAVLLWLDLHGQDPVQVRARRCWPVPPLLVGVLDRPVPLQPPVHDGHEVRVPPGRGDGLVLEDVLPVPAVLGHPRQRPGHRRLRFRHRPPPARRRAGSASCASR